MTYFKKSKFTSQNFGHKTPKKEEPLKIKTNTFSKIVLETFSLSKNT
jgi:hypothetical protein